MVKSGSGNLSHLCCFALFACLRSTHRRRAEGGAKRSNVAPSSRIKCVFARNHKYRMNSIHRNEIPNEIKRDSFRYGCCTVYSVACVHVESHTNCLIIWTPKTSNETVNRNFISMPFYWISRSFVVGDTRWWLNFRLNVCALRSSIDVELHIFGNKRKTRCRCASKPKRKIGGDLDMKYKINLLNFPVPFSLANVILCVSVAPFSTVIALSQVNWTNIESV